MTETRKLAVVMFTDIVGYTVLMSKDEQKALQVLQKNKKMEIMKLIKIIGYIGLFIMEVVIILNVMFYQKFGIKFKKNNRSQSADPQK